MSESKKKHTTALHELLAVQTDLCGSRNNIIGETTKLFSNGSKFEGKTRRYTSTQEEGDTFANEDVRLVTTAAERLEYTLAACVKSMDCEVSIETTNAKAKADIVLNGEVLVHDVPAQALLQLEKQVKKIREFVSIAPTLDQTIEWQMDPNRANTFKGEPAVTYKTKKIKTHKVIVPATDKHPAQVATDTVDERVGYWTTTPLSGAITAEEKCRLLTNTDSVLRAVKKARQRANQQTVDSVKVGETIRRAIFGK